MGADHAYVTLLQTAPGIAWVLGYTVAAEIGDVGVRQPCPRKVTTLSHERLQHVVGALYAGGRLLQPIGDVPFGSWVAMKPDNLSFGTRT